MPPPVTGRGSLSKRGRQAAWQLRHACLAVATCSCVMVVLCPTSVKPAGTSLKSSARDSRQCQSRPSAAGRGRLL